MGEIVEKKKASAAQIKANHKYRQKKYNDGTNKRLDLTVKADVYYAIDDYCKKYNISKVQFVGRATRYFIDKDIDITKIE